MTNEQFLQQFGHFIDAPNGVQKLREMILQLAVRGKLVEQEAGDAQVGELIDAISAEKQRLIEKGLFKKGKKLPKITADDEPHSIPDSWKWVRLGDIAIPQAGFAFKSREFNEVGKGLPLIRIRDVGKTHSNTFYDGEYREEFLVEEGDYLISMDGEFRVATWKGPNALLNQRVTRLIFIGEYCAKRFIADSLQFRLHELQGVKAYTTVDHLSGKQIAETVIGLPPLAEQHRIVAKIDELMTLCDQLEAERNAREATHQRLIRAVHHPLTEAADAKATQTAWHRIRDNFADLYTTLESVQALRQTILQLAVQGRLVAQNKNEGTGKELLENILSLIGNNKTSRNAGYEFIDNEDYQIHIPSSWAQSILENISIFTNGKAHEQYVHENGEYVLINSKFVSNSGLIRKYTSHRLTPLNKGDIAIVMSDVPNGRALARCYLVTESDKYTLNQRIGGIQTPLMNDKFMSYVLDRNPFYLRFDDGKKQTNLRKNQLLSCPIPIPPLAEQNRIVAKIDELMLLCDQLEANIRDKNDTATRYAEAIVQQIAAA